MAKPQIFQAARATRGVARIFKTSMLRALQLLESFAKALITV